MGVFSVRKTTEQFIADARVVHGNMYDYSKVDYQTNQVKVCIICPIHGEFWQTPNSHLCGKGCPKCRCEKLKAFVFGIGVNDTLGFSNTTAHQRWLQMMERCGSKEYKTRFPSYIDVTVCEEWKYFSRFKEWFDKHYVEGWQLDKDILFKGNKVYSPETCCFVPPEINYLLTKRKNKRGRYPIGVHLGNNGKYCAMVGDKGKRKYLGYYNTPEEAFNVYKKAKEDYIKEVANRYKERLDPRVYEALCNYKVEITD